jgi:hypothetical protein
MNMTKNIFNIVLTSCLVAAAFNFTVSASYAGSKATDIGGDSAMHHVHLTGFGGDNSRKRELLPQTHRACLGLNQSLQKPAKLLAPDAVPPIIEAFDINIYYTSNRTLIDVKSTSYGIDSNDCSLYSWKNHNATLNSSIGSCDMDLVKEKAKGKCDANAHQTASARYGFEDGAMKREPAKTTLESLLTKNIARTDCQVSQLKILGTEKCVAHPQSAFPIPASPYNFERAGLLLEMTGPVMTIKADQVDLNLALDPELFSIPKNLAVRSIGVKP